MKYSLNNLYAYRYYEEETGPLASMSALTLSEAIGMGYRGFNEDEIKQLYNYRTEKESIMRYIFKKKGGTAKINFPYYFAVFDEDQYNHPLEFRHTNSRCIRIPVTEFDSKTISFTYGTSYYSFTRKDNHPTRRRLYFADEIEDIINTYGIIPYDGDSPLCVEMQVWDDEVLRKCYESNKYTCECTNQQISEEKLLKEIARLTGDAKALGAKEVEEAVFLDKAGIHGYNHSLRVWLLSVKLAELAGLSEEDTRILLYCAAYHDIGRINNGQDHDHGFMSFQRVKELNLLPEDMDSASAGIIRYIIENHPLDDLQGKENLDKYGLTEKERAWKLYSVFKDADGLDRCRINDLNVKYLRTEAAKTSVKFAYELLKIIRASQ
jgi:hypothetical protein